MHDILCACVCVKELYKEANSLERHTPQLRQTVLLSVGTLCNNMINTMRRHNKPIPQLMSTVEEVSSVYSLPPYSFFVEIHNYFSLINKIILYYLHEKEIQK